MKRLPTDDQPFPAIIDQGLLYADKTRYIYEMFKSHYRCYFLSRPPRFGKTLLLQTLKELFTGNRERFKGLWIDQSDYDFKAYPTISLTLDLPSDSPETLKAAFQAQLQGIAQAEDLDVSGSSSSMRLTSLIKRLSRKRQSQVAVLLDDFDAPVTNHMDNPSLVKAHTDFLSYLFGAFKSSDVQSCLGFMMVTGIASYDSTLSGYYVVDLEDVSLMPQYAGIGGFTLEEFNALFEDRLEATLAELKDKGPKGSGAVDDLRAKIIKWYGGYRWGGETRVLNPYSTLHFFSQKAFDSYWINSVRPGLLDVLIKAKPKGFLKFALESPPPMNMENMALDKSEPARFLIRSGYLTLDDSLDEVRRAWGDSLLDDAGYFQFPNYEVASNFIRECFTALFSFMSSDELKTIATELKKALLSRKTATVQDILTGFIRPLSPYLGTAWDRTFVTLVQWIFKGLGFTALAAAEGVNGSFDLDVKLGLKERLVIKLSHRPNQLRLEPEEKDKVLADMAPEKLPKEKINAALANLAIIRLSSQDFYPICLANRPQKLAEAEVNHRLAKVALSSLAAKETNRILAKIVWESLSLDEQEDIRDNAATRAEKFKKTIASDLSEAVKIALTAIIPTAQDTIGLGLAIYGSGHHIKTAFAPKSPQNKIIDLTKGPKAKATASRITP